MLLIIEFTLLHLLNPNWRSGLHGTELPGIGELLQYWLNSARTGRFSKARSGKEAVTQPFNTLVPLIFSLPVVVFVAETCVVTLATIRTIFIARGWKTLAATLGFFEVSIWLYAIAQVMQHLSSPGCFLSFAGGFALGNYLGVLIEQKLALGNVVVHIVSRNQESELAESLRWAGFGVTALDANGANGTVQAMFTVIRRGQLTKVISIILRHDPKAFYSVGDLRSAAEGVYPSPRRWPSVIPSVFQRMSRERLVLERIGGPSPASAGPRTVLQDSE